MVHVYRAAVYVIMIVAALLLYMLLRKFCSSRTRAVPVVVALLTACGLLWCTHFVLSKPSLLRKYAPILKLKKGGSKSMVYMETDVRICDPDGSNDRQLLPQDFITTRDIAWSPDGTRMVCSRVRDSREGMNLFIYDAEGGNPVQLTSGKGISRRPSWSPDGTRIVFDFRPSLRQITTDLFVVNADGSERHKLELGENVHAYHPVWAPDGKTIFCCVKVNHRDDVWALDSDGGNLRQLTFTPDQTETELAVSPDGETIVLSVNRRELHLMNADGSDFRPLIKTDGKTCRGRDPSWSPDGTRLFYAGFATDKSRRFIKEISVDGSGLQQIPVMDGKLLTPVLKPDGSRLAYLRFVKTVVQKLGPSQGPPIGGRSLLDEED